MKRPSDLQNQPRRPLRPAGTAAGYPPLLLWAARRLLFCQRQRMRSRQSRARSTRAPSRLTHLAWPRWLSPWHLSPRCVYIYIHTYARAHTHTHTHTNTCICIWTLNRMNMRNTLPGPRQQSGAKTNRQACHGLFSPGAWRPRTCKGRRPWCLGKRYQRRHATFTRVAAAGAEDRRGHFVPS